MLSTGPAPWCLNQGVFSLNALAVLTAMLVPRRQRAHRVWMNGTETCTHQNQSEQKAPVTGEKVAYFTPAEYHSCRIDHLNLHGRGEPAYIFIRPR